MPVAAPTQRSPEELLHELQVRQVELEMQNDELRSAQRALEESLDRFIDLYDFAPAGHFTINSGGLLTECNLAGAKLLGRERRQVLSHRFAPLVISNDRDRWQTAFRMRDRRGYARVRLNYGVCSFVGLLLHTLFAFSYRKDQNPLIASRVVLPYTGHEYWLAISC